MSSDDTFLYFGYGSNLSKARIHINNPSAKFHAVAKLQDYKLTFGKQSDWEDVVIKWHGGMANMVQTPGEVVWGVLWQIDSKDMSNLDKQEGHLRKLQITVTTQEGKTESCFAYHSHSPPDSPFTSCEPSPRYKEICLTGAIQNGLPQYYIDMMKAVKDNGYEGTDYPVPSVK